MHVNVERNTSFACKNTVNESRLKEGFDRTNSVLIKDSEITDLSQRLQVYNHNHSNASGFQELDYPLLSDDAKLPLIAPIKHVPLPPELLEQFSNMQYNCIIGIFLSVSRAWLTIDSDLYVWNFEDGSDVAYFDGLSDTIVSVGLVLPKPGVFLPQITHLLVITTAIDIITLGVTFDMLQNGHTEMHLLPEPLLSTPTDNTYMLSLAGTSNGRIFMGGKDGCIYELTYQARDGWFTNRVNKVNHSKSSISYLLPAFVSNAFYEDDPVTQMCVDDSRNILYCRTEKGSIHVHDLGFKGESFSRIASLSMHSIINMACTASKRTLDKNVFRNIVSISPILMSESINIQLLATTSSGIRLYFVIDYFSSFPKRPIMLTLVHVRFPPGYSTTGSKPANVHSAVYSNGCTMMASAHTPDTDTIWVMHSDVFPSKNSELSTTINLSCKVWMVCAMPRDSQISLGRPSTVALIDQVYNPPERFIVVTAQGCFIITKHRPVDQLKQLFSLGYDSPSISSFFKLYRPIEACAMCLKLMCSGKGSDIADKALRAYCLYGGEPKSGLSLTTYSQLPENVEFSERHNSLYLYVARVLLPVWRSKLVVGNGVNSGPYLPGLPVDYYLDTKEQLSGVLALLDSSIITHQSGDSFVHHASFGPVSPRHKLSQFSCDYEKQSMESLHSLVDVCVQLLSLWKLLCDHNFTEIVENLPKDRCLKLATAEFSDLVYESRDVIAALVECLINQQLRDNLPTESLATRLQEVCPLFFDQRDRICTYASQQLRAAQNTTDADTRLRLLNDSLASYKKVTDTLQLESVVKEYLRTGFYVGIVDLCISVGCKKDPQDLALHYYKAKVDINQDAELIKAFNGRVDCYKHVTDILNQLQNAMSPFVRNSAYSEPGAVLETLLKLVFATEDELLHCVVYEWMLDHGMADRLLSIDSGYMAGFLARGASEEPFNADLMDLLWRYEEKRGNYSKAASLLEKLADRRSVQVDLPKRIEYLSRACVALKCCSVSSELLHDLEEKLQVAQIQKSVLAEVMKLDGESVVNYVKLLNENLVDISSLYEDVAEPLGLYECQLLILKCASHYDAKLVSVLWVNVINSALECNDKSLFQAVITSKLADLGPVDKYFPVDVIASNLEKCSVLAGMTDGWVCSAVSDAGVHIAQLVNVYSSLYRQKDSFWIHEARPFYYLEVVSKLMMDFATVAASYKVLERRTISTRFLDLISEYLVELQTVVTPPADLISQLKLTQGILDAVL